MPLHSAAFAAFWAEFDAVTAGIAEALIQQLLLARKARDDLPGCIDRFDQRRLILRNWLSRTERAVKAAQRPSSADARFLRLLRRRMGKMQKLADLARQVEQGKTSPLYARMPPREAGFGQHLAALNGTLKHLQRLINGQPQSQVARDLGCFKDIPLDPLQFVTHAHAAYRVALAQARPKPLRFLDVGCGGGMRVIQAAAYFDIAAGLDFDPAYVAAGQAAVSRMGLARCDIFHANALTFGAYDQFDVIYFYQPMSDARLLETLEQRIVAQARPGTILVAPYGGFSSRAGALGCGRVAQAVFVSRTTPRAADMLRRQAQRIGTQVLDPDQLLPDDGVAWLAGLARACAANGYLPD